MSDKPDDTTKAPTQSADTHPYPYTTNVMEGVPFTSQLWTPRKGTRESEQREREVNGLHKLYTDLMKKPVILEWVTFQKYAILFDKKLLESINPVDKTQTDPIRELSEEFLKLINPYKEYHVRMPDGTMHTFPPVYSPVARLGDNVLKALDIYDNILTKCTDQPWKREEATALMISAMIESQNPAIVAHQQKKYNKYNNEITKQLHVNNEDAGDTGTETNHAVNSTGAVGEQSVETSSGAIQGLDYVLD